MVKLAKAKFERCDELWRHYSELKKRNEQITTENESLRQRFVKMHEIDVCKLNLYRQFRAKSRGTEKRVLLSLLLSHSSRFSYDFYRIFFQINRISNDSEMNHRSHQSSSEDARSRNKRSDVLRKYKTMDGATRRQAMEAFGKQSRRAEIWYKKDLTCRIFLVPCH